MSSYKTANLNMHSWAPTDPVVRSDFNENFSKIDAAIGEMRAAFGGCEIYVGTYTGTGAKVYSLTFPKRPVYYLVNQNTNSSVYSVFVRDNVLLSVGADVYAKLSVSGTTVTFTSGNSSTPMNYTGQIYSYIAFAPAQQ